MGKKPQTDTRARTDKRTCLNGSKPTPQVNAKSDVMMKLSVIGTRTDTHTQSHTRQNLYIPALRAVKIIHLASFFLHPQMTTGSKITGSLTSVSSHERHELPNVGAAAVDVAVPNAGADDNDDPKLKPATSKTLLKMTGKR